MPATVPTGRDHGGMGPMSENPELLRRLVTVAGLLSRSRPPYLVDARAEAARRLFLEHPEMRLREIGDALVGRDHSTVHSLIRRAVR